MKYLFQILYTEFGGGAQPLRRREATTSLKKPVVKFGMNKEWEAAEAYLRALVDEWRNIVAADARGEQVAPDGNSAYLGSLNARGKAAYLYYVNLTDDARCDHELIQRTPFTFVW